MRAYEGDNVKTGRAQSILLVDYILMRFSASYVGLPQEKIRINSLAPRLWLVCSIYYVICMGTNFTIDEMKGFDLKRTFLDLPNLYFHVSKEDSFLLHLAIRLVIPE